MKAVEVGRIIKLLLMQNAEVTDLIGKKIFPIVAPEKTDYPFLIYGRTGVSPAYTKDRKSISDTVRVGLTVACAEYEQSVDIVEAVFKVLQRCSGAFDGVEIDDIRMVNSDEDFQDDCFMQNIEFEVDINNN